MKLTNTERERIAPLLGRPTYLDARGPKRKDSRPIFEGVL
jgi:hypothetical protein